MARYVILEHDHPFLHWDFMLEEGAGLRTWRLAAPPRAGTNTTAEFLAVHRRHYLDYEGPVSGGRGTVQRWDHGSFTWHVDQAERVVMALDGSRFRGMVELVREMSGKWSARFRGLAEQESATPTAPQVP